MQNPQTMQTSQTSSRLAASSSVDSFLSWIAAPSTSQAQPPKKQHSKTGPRQHPETAMPHSSATSSSTSSPSMSSSSSSSNSTPSPPNEASTDPRVRASPSQSTSSGNGNTYILADGLRLRELSRSPLEEMGLPLFASAAAAAVNIGKPVPPSNASSASSESKKSKKHHHHHHRTTEASGDANKPLNA